MKSPGGDPDSVDPRFSPPPQRSSSPRMKNIFVIKSLAVIVALTVLVLVINYYLISNCPKDGEVEQVPVDLQHTGGISDGGLEEKRKVTLSVYYEVLCPDSKHFISKQLAPVWKKFGAEFLRLRFVPFGKGSMTGGNSDDPQFTCQHGPEECHGNKLHACIIRAYNESTQMSLITCSMERFRLWGATQEAITEVVKGCINELVPSTEPRADPMCPEASRLLAGHAKETLELRPRVSFIPTIAIDDSLSNQAQILRDLNSAVCNALKRNQVFQAPC